MLEGADNKPRYPLNDSVKHTENINLREVTKDPPAKSHPSTSEVSKNKVTVSPSPSSYLTLKSHLLLMNTPSSKSNRYKRSHSSTSNPETRVNQLEENKPSSTEKTSAVDSLQGKFLYYQLINS